MKKLILVLTYLISVASFGQAEYEKIAITENVESSTAGKVNMQESNGEINFRLPENIPLTIIPPTAHYTPLTPTIGGHFKGVDQALGNIVQTTAGVTNRIWFTADQTTITAGTFYVSNPTGKGSTAEAIQSVSNDDDQKQYFAQDLISAGFPVFITYPAGIYGGQLSARISTNIAQQRYTIEAYKCNSAGTPIASGVTGAPVGALGVTVIAILDSGLFNMVAGNITGVPISGVLGSPVSFNSGERVRYHVSAEKVGAAGSTIAMEVFYGSNYNSYYDAPVVFNTNSIVNASTVTGVTATNALDNLNILKEDIANKATDFAVVNNIKYPTTQAVKTELDGIREYTKSITVGSGGTYATLELLFANEPLGKTLITLLDTEYTCTDPSFVVKEGWIIQGKGYGKTNITFNFTTVINPDTSGLQVRVNCELRDFKVTSVNNTNLGGYSQYALHSDYVGAFKAKITRCWFKTTSNPNVPDANGYNGLSVGVGTWEGQELEFRECILQGQSVAIDNKYTLNLHNTYITGTHLLPCRVSFYNCQLTGGFTTVLISDVYSNDADPNNTRIKDLFEFVGCEVKGGLWLRSHSQFGTIDKKNGLNFNFSGTNVDEFLNTAEIVDTSLSNYDVNSLPVTKDVRFEKNIGASNIVAGDFVCYVYANRKPEYHSAALTNTIIGIEKLTSSNINNFAGISMTNSLIGNYAHLVTSAIAYTASTYSTINIGDNVAFNPDDGLLVKTHFAGIGKVLKKTDTNRLGILLNDEGVSNETYGTYTSRGVLRMRGSAGTSGVGHPSIWMEDKNVLNELTNYAISAGTYTNVAPFYQQGRFSINDNIKQVERFAIDTDGINYVNRKLKILNQAIVGDTAPYNALPNFDSQGLTFLGSTSNQFVFGRAMLDTGNSGAYFNYDSGTNTTIIQSVTAGTAYRDLTLNPYGGKVFVPDGTLDGHAVNRGQLDLKADITTLPTSGTYAPTLSNTLNVTGVSLQEAVYSKIGDIVTVTIGISASVTSGATNSQITVTLPVNRVGTSTVVSGGFSGNIAVSSEHFSGIFQMLSTSEVRMYFAPTNTGTAQFGGTFSYKVN